MRLFDVSLFLCELLEGLSLLSDVVWVLPVVPITGDLTAALLNFATWADLTISLSLILSNYRSRRSNVIVISQELSMIGGLTLRSSQLLIDDIKLLLLG